MACLGVIAYFSSRFEQSEIIFSIAVFVILLYGFKTNYELVNQVHQCKQMLNEAGIDCPDLEGEEVHPN